MTIINYIPWVTGFSRETRYSYGSCTGYCRSLERTGVEDRELEWLE